MNHFVEIKQESEAILAAMGIGLLLGVLLAWWKGQL
jgi:hypothetical protein